MIRVEMFSSNKCHTTSNGNVVNSSSREIISDKELVIKRSGLLQLLQPGDYLMTNMVLHLLVVKQSCHHFYGAKSHFQRMSCKGVKKFTMSCAFLKDYWWDKEVHFFDKVIPLTVGGSINQIWKVACLNTNSQEPLLFE